MKGKLCVCCKKEVLKRQKNAKYCLVCVRSVPYVYGNRASITIAIDKEVLKKLRAYALRKNLPISHVVESVVKEHLKGRARA